jgi:hypothetical protein
MAFSYSGLGDTMWDISPFKSVPYCRKYELKVFFLDKEQNLGRIDALELAFSISFA